MNAVLLLIGIVISMIVSGFCAGRIVSVKAAFIASVITSLPAIVLLFMVPSRQGPYMEENLPTFAAALTFLICFVIGAVMQKKAATRKPTQRKRPR